VSSLVAWILEVIAAPGYPGIAGLIALEGIFPLVPSEIILPLAGSLAVEGRLALPLLLLVVTGAFTAPLETFYLMTYGAVVVIAASRCAAAALWVRARGPAGLAASAGRALRADLAGLAGLALLGFAALAVSVYVVLPKVGPGPAADYGKALATGGPADPFGSAAQAGYFLHLFLVLPALAVMSAVLLRRRGNLSRPLLLPRAARRLGSSGPAGRLAVAVAAVALAAVLIGLNGGAAPGRLPPGPICALARATCAAAARLHRAG